ncbi:MAG: PKD domain-containing protein [Thermoplasmata archaeon]|nr:PKD domain-containing protein [Thermoplasmata archaeon]
MGKAALASLSRLAPAVLLAALFFVPAFSISSSGVSPIPTRVGGQLVPSLALGPLAAAERSLSHDPRPVLGGPAAPVWNQTYPVLSGDPAMAYDVAGGIVVLFQGLAAAQYNSTWTYVSGNWTHLPLVHTPPARSGASMVYDAANQEVVLFGGCYSAYPTLFDNDTWVFSKDTWTELTTPANATPPARRDASMTYDASRGAVLMFGGTSATYFYNNSTATGQVYNDTWAFSGGHWTRLATPLAPSQRFGASFGYDFTTQSDVLFGGFDTQYFPNSTLVRNDTWTFAGGNWSLATPATSPASRVVAGFAYDSAAGAMLLFGGSTSANPYVSGNGAQNDTWEYANGSWAMLSIPTPPRDDSEFPMVAGPSNGSVLLFGAPAWTFHGGSWSISGPHPHPPAVSAPLLSYDAKDAYVLLFQSGSFSNLFAGTWKFEGGAWTNISLAQGPNPPSSTGAAMTYDALDGYVLLWGGSANQTWTFEGGRWSKLTPGVQPPPLWGSQLVYDPEAGYSVLFGGSECSPDSWDYQCQWHNDTWGFANGSWFRVATTGGVAPPGRNDAAMVFDAADGYLLLFGGRECRNAYNCTNGNDTWQFAHGTWSQVPTHLAPPARESPAATYDPGNGSVVLFGGAPFDDSGYYGGALNGTWTYSDGQWTQAGFPGQFLPPPSVLAGLVYVPDRASDLLLDSSSESWTLQLPPRTGLPVHGAISASATEGDVPLRVQFFGEASGGIGPYSYLWTFGDGSSGLGPTPSHVYNRSGAYVATVTVFDSLDQSSAANVTVRVDALPSATGGVAPSSGNVPLTVGFAARVVGGGAPYTAVWSFGDGTNGTTLNVSHTYRTVGSFAVTLLVLDRFGTPAFAGPWLVTVDSQLSPLTLTAQPVPVALGGTVELTTTVGGGSGPFTFAWTHLPPGCLGADAPVRSCVPSAIGTFYPVVTVSDTENESASAVATVVVLPPPLHLNVIVSPETVEIGHPVNIDAQYSGGIGPLVFHWSELPPGCTATSNLVTCVPTSAGLFPVQANLSDAANQTEDGNATVEVEPVSAAASTGPGLGGGLSPGEYTALGAAVGVAAVAAVAWVAWRVSRRQG